MKQVRTIKDIRLFDAQLVSCFGFYERYEIIKGSDNKAENTTQMGRAVIVLGDGTKVLLYPVWHKDNLRSAEELRMFNKKEVEIKGRIYLEAPNISEDNPAQNLSIPCLMEITDIIRKR